MSVKERPRQMDVEMAKKAVWWDDEVDDSLTDLFHTDNNPDSFSGTKEELRKIRGSMKKYEEKEADMMEDRQYYKARFRLQFLETSDSEE